MVIGWLVGISEVVESIGLDGQVQEEMSRRKHTLLLRLSISTGPVVEGCGWLGGVEGWNEGGWLCFEGKAKISLSPK